MDTPEFKEDDSSPYEDEFDDGQPNSNQNNVNTSESLEAFQSDEQRRVLDTVAEVRKCGLEGILALPQLVVCGDQSAGKSSVLEALTEIPFPRKDNLCTRFATEITLRFSSMDSLTIKIIPDDKRNPAEQESLKLFTESISNFHELPNIMNKAMSVMGVGDLSSMPKAFARDVLSIEIEGPSRPQLTLVDLPGIVQNETKDATKADVKVVAEITDHYIAQSRTICLPVVSAVHDYANQSILTKVRGVDPEGERTLGIITKPDQLPKGSGSEKSFIGLALNRDVFFKLGWHVVKNRSHEESEASFEERNNLEAIYFRTSNLKALPRNTVGIGELRKRLSRLLFEHIKQELPKLFVDLNDALRDAKSQLNTLGQSRSTSEQCKEYLALLSNDFRDVCVDAVRGHYEGPHFTYGYQEDFMPRSPSAIRRLRAMVQNLNLTFAETMRLYGHTYRVELPDAPSKADITHTQHAKASELLDLSVKELSHSDSVDKVRKAIARNRGRELLGNFNPLIISELFWEQSHKWGDIASEHLERVACICRQFLQELLQEMCPRDVYSRLWSSHFEEMLKKRQEEASQELEHLLEDVRGYPINYNHYYTDLLQKRRRDRDQKSLSQSLNEAIVNIGSEQGQWNDGNPSKIDITRVLNNFAPIQQDMEVHSCEEALDGMLAIYKVTQKTFIANVTTQVIERHVIRGLENIFSPLFVSSLSSADIEGFASEPASIKTQRAFLEDRIMKLENGRSVLRQVMHTAT